MAEQSVQVHVSLIEGMPHDYSCRSHQGALCDCYRAEFAALLSPPTPNAEPVRIEDMAPAVNRELDERDFPDEEEQRIQAIIDAVDDWAPNIDDMAVGTTFRAPHLNLDTDRVRLWVRTPHGLLDLTDSRTDGRYTTAAVNSSTIRDVTPPKDAA